MRCGLLKLSRLLREGRAEKRSRGEHGPKARRRSEHCARFRPAERGSEGKSEREFAGWTISVDNFS